MVPIVRKGTLNFSKHVTQTQTGGTAKWDYLYLQKNRTK